MSSFTVTLPAPPSTNNLFFNRKGGGRSRSAEYNSWLDKAGVILNATRAGKRFAVVTPCTILIRVGKCNEARDLSNFLKPAEDLIVKCGVIPNDNVKHVKRTSVEEAFGDVPDGWVSVLVETLA